MAKFFYICCLFYSPNTLMRCAGVSLPVTTHVLIEFFADFKHAYPYIFFLKSAQKVAGKYY